MDAKCIFQISFTLNAEIAGPGGEHSTPIPLEHRLSVNPADRQQMFAFTEREEGSTAVALSSFSW